MGKDRTAKELISSITGKGTTMTAKALVNVKLKLQGEIATLLKKEKLTDKQKNQLANKRKQLRDVKAELADEADKSGRSLAQGSRDAQVKKKMEGKPNPLVEDFEQAMAAGTKKRRREKVRKEIEAKNNKPETFESEKRKIMGKANTDAGRQKELIELAKKYGRTITIAGMTFGPKTTKATGKKMMRGGLIKTGHMDMRKGGLFYK